MKLTFKGNHLETLGTFPQIGSKAPGFSLVKTDLSSISLKDLAGKNVLLNIFVSLDTSVCANSVVKFNQAADKLANTRILCVSMDLPFAAERFCAAKGLKNVITASAFRSPEFGKSYGLTIKDGPLAQLLARAVIIINPKGDVVYAEVVPEIAQEPDYEAALKVITR